MSKAMEEQRTIFCKFDSSEFGVVVVGTNNYDELDKTVKLAGDMYLYKEYAQQTKLEAADRLDEAYIGVSFNKSKRLVEAGLNRAVEAINLMSPILAELLPVDTKYNLCIGKQGYVLKHNVGKEFIVSTDKMEIDDIYNCQLRHISELLGKEFVDKRFIEDLGIEEKALYQMKRIYTVGDWCRCMVWGGCGMLDGAYLLSDELLGRVKQRFKDLGIYERVKYLRCVSTIYTYSSLEFLDAKLYEIDYRDIPQINPNHIIRWITEDNLLTVKDYLNWNSIGKSYLNKYLKTYFAYFGIDIDSWK